MPVLKATSVIKEVKETSYQIKPGNYYFAEIDNKTNEVFSVIRFELDEKTGIQSYIKARKRHIEIDNINKYDQGFCELLLLNLLGLNPEKEKSKYFNDTVIDSDTFVKYYNQFYSELVPFVL